jgi:hypothetical protein
LDPRRLWEPERTRMAAVYYAARLDRDNLPGDVTHLCPRGPIATGVGPVWNEEKDVARTGLELVEGADIRRAGPNGPHVVGSERYADPDHWSDR